MNFDLTSWTRWTRSFRPEKSILHAQSFEFLKFLKRIMFLSGNRNKSWVLIPKLYTKVTSFLCLCSLITVVCVGSQKTSYALRVVQASTRNIIFNTTNDHHHLLKREITQCLAIGRRIMSINHNHMVRLWRYFNLSIARKVSKYKAPENQTTPLNVTNDNYHNMMTDKFTARESSAKSYECVWVFGTNSICFS